MPILSKQHKEILEDRKESRVVKKNLSRQEVNALASNPFINRMMKMEQPPKKNVNNNERRRVIEIETIRQGSEKSNDKEVEHVEIILKEDWENRQKKIQAEHTPSIMVGSVLGKFLNSLFL